ncbi:MAG: elongation factor P [Marinilabiliales bacterium]|nr:MAG: elongation factor P [Marinilabiliales bacterium]
MADTSDFKNGLCIEYNNDLYTIVQFQHVKPGKGPAFVRTKMKSLTTGKVLDNTFSAGVKINIARVERRPYQFLYSDDLGFHFMHRDTFEQLMLEPQLIESPELLLEGQQVEIVYHADTETPLSCDMPPFVVMEVTYTEPGVRGDTSSTSSMKPATIQTGATINVPLFINTGDKIKVDTRTKTYAERVKE